MFEATDAADRGPAGAEVRRRLAAEVGLPSRLGYTALLLVGLGSAAVTGALLATEPALPARTRIAFLVMTLIGLSWAAFSAWVLARRRVLFAQQRLVAARMAVAFTALFTAAALGIGLLPGGSGGALAAAGLGAAMLAVAIALLVRARRRVDELTRRRRELERLLATPEFGR